MSKGTVIVRPDRAEPPLILAYDVGSSSVRATLFDRLGRAVAETTSQAAYKFHTTPDGGAETDADALLRRIADCIDGALALAGSRSDAIEGVAGATFVSNVLGVDADGAPVSPIYTYADTRDELDARALQARLDEAAIHQRTGCLLRASYLPARFTWLERTQPEVMSKAQRWTSIGAYLFQQLFGRSVVSYSVASWSGLLNRRNLTWDEALLAELPVEAEQLSPLVDSGQPFSGLTGEWARRWPTLRDVPWFPPIGDGAAANVGSGCVSPERVALTIGTSGAMRVVEPVTGCERGEVPWGLWEYQVDRGRALLGGALSEGGNVFAWLRETLRLPDGETLEAQLAAMEPDEHGLTILPFLAGERSPGWAGDARASLVGLHLDTRPLDILRASLESVAYRFAIIFQILREHLARASVGVADWPEAIVASGGALLRSPAWLQIVADVLNRPVTVSTETQATSRGAALLALEALGVLPDLRAAPDSLGDTLQPDPRRSDRYAAAIERQRELYQMLIGDL